MKAMKVNDVDFNGFLLFIKFMACVQPLFQIFIKS